MYVRVIFGNERQVVLFRLYQNTLEPNKLHMKQFPRTLNINVGVCEEVKVNTDSVSPPLVGSAPQEVRTLPSLQLSFSLLFEPK